MTWTPPEPWSPPEWSPPAWRSAEPAAAEADAAYTEPPDGDAEPDVVYVDAEAYVEPETVAMPAPNGWGESATESWTRGRHGRTAR